MFSSNFLSGGNPLSAVSSAVNKFSLFGEDGDPEQNKQKQQQQANPQQKPPIQQGNGQPASQIKGGPKPGGQLPQGSPKTGPQSQQGPSRGGPQQQSASGKPGTQQQPGGPGPGARAPGAAQGGPSSQGPAKTAAQGGPPSQGPAKAAAQGGPPSQGAAKAAAQAKSGPGPGGKSLCPICKNTELNVQSKEPPNYKNCTQCKSQVCSLCGFSPPDSAGKEWLCLNCQMQRALGGAEPPGPPMKKAQPQANKPPTASHPPSAAPQKTDIPGSPERKQATVNAAPPKQTQESAKPQQQMPKGGPSPAKSAPLQQQPQPPKQESGLFGFGFGGLTDTARSRSPSPQPAGKVMGFGSSFFSSASNLITSAVQDETSPTPPTARKESVSAQAPAKALSAAGTKAPAQKPEAKKAEPPQQPKATTTPGKKDVPPSGPQKKEGPSQPPSKAAPSSCPLCKVQLNKGSKDPPNYNTCTECKSTVCNQCGFNPMPHVKEVKEWLCLNCQMKRALGGDDPPGPMMKPTPQSKKPSPASQPFNKAVPPPVSPQKTQGSPPVTGKDVNKLAQTSQSAPSTKQHPQQNPPQQVIDKTQTTKNQASPAKSAPSAQSEPPKEETSYFGLGFGGVKDTSRSRSPSPQPTGSITGKVFGFGSSIFSQASNLISSAVQDEGPTKSPAVQKDSSSAQASPKISTGDSKALPTKKEDDKKSEVAKQEQKSFDQKKIEAKPASQQSDDLLKDKENMTKGKQLLGESSKVTTERKATSTPGSLQKKLLSSEQPAKEEAKPVPSPAKKVIQEDKKPESQKPLSQAHLKHRLNHRSRIQDCLALGLVGLKIDLDLSHHHLTQKALSLTKF
ncbi:hypothetical protein AALO_G00149280 [Alosa alosa]|uniref:Zinc finger piccolo-type domain-containing protein n=1 Tax=Alosa alosa TaxID=278164 RepID=A0AAV6GDL1_9TELE|nr:hypothetical protein AALO_G00149280 [Alosa alosa]